MSVPAVSSEMSVGTKVETFLACDWSAVEKLIQCSSLNALALPYPPFKSGFII